MWHSLKSFSILALAALLLGTLSTARAISPPQTSIRSDDPLIAQLEQTTAGNLRVSYHAETGKVRFLATDAKHPIQRPASLSASATPEQAARAFLASYGALFGLGAGNDLTVLRAPTGAGKTFMRFQQRYRGVPILGGELIVQVDKSGNVLSASGEVVPDLSLSVTPAIEARAAAERARALVATTYDLRPEDLSITAPQLWVFNPALLGGPGLRISRLTWRMDVTSRAGVEPVRELVLVDAQGGNIALHFNQIAEAKERHICNDNNVIDTDTNQDNDCTPAQYVRNEGDPPTGNTDVDLAYDYSGATYDFYFSNFGRDSLNGSGLPLISLVKYCPNAANCPYQNANWDGVQMTYGDGYASADDVVGHELTHGFTQFSSGLFYYFQSGAINESMSDVFGELIDLTDGVGTDTPDVRWALGEDLPPEVGVVRYMADPTVFANPDRTGSPFYVTDDTEADNGGVHSNSGVNNKALYLIVDGDTFNGQTITGIGIAKAAQIYYLVNNALLVSGSDYQDLGDALRAACATLTGTHGITSADCDEVNKAVLATEMDQVPANAPTPEAPVCETGQTVNTVFSDDLENVNSGNWGSAPVSGTINLWSYPQDPSTNPIGSPYATSGVNNFWGDDRAGEPADYSIAMSNSVTLPANAFMHFNQAYSFERSGPFKLNGGVVEYSTNGGATWHDAGPLFTVNGYNGTISGNGNPLAGRKGFGGLSYGYISSRLNLSSLAGQSARFRFRIGTGDGPGNLGWFIDDIQIYTCTGPAAPNTAPAANATGRVEVVAGGPSVTREIATVSDVQDAVSTLAVTVTGTPEGMNLTVSNDTGIIAATVAGQCLTAPGTYTITLTVEDSGGQTGTTTFKVQVDAPGERVQDTSFEDGAPNPYWDVTQPGTGARICQPGACAIDPTAGPRTGNWWVRFGGPTGVPSDGYAQQEINILPGSTTTLEFYIWLGVHSGSGISDTVRLLIDDTEIFSVTDATTAYDAGYIKVTRDLTAFGGGTHMLRFEEHNEASINRFRLHLDDVSVTTTPNTCTNPKIYLPLVTR